MAERENERAALLLMAIGYDRRALEMECDWELRVKTEPLARTAINLIDAGESL